VEAGATEEQLDVVPGHPLGGEQAARREGVHQRATPSRITWKGTLQ
jgi:hypothetical protein